MKSNEKKPFFSRVLSVLKTIFFIFNLLTQLANIALLAYLSTVTNEKQVVNLCLLVFAVIYLIVYVVLTLFDKFNTKKAKTVAKKTYKYAKRVMKFISLGITVYSIYLSTQHLSFISTIIAGCALNFMITSIIIEILMIIVARKVKKIKEKVTERLNNIAKSSKNKKPNKELEEN